MSKLALVLASMLFAASNACAAAPATSKPSAPAAAGKSQAPVDVAAKLSVGTAKLSIAFGKDASGVDIRISGADGLKVTSVAQPVNGAVVRAGQTLSLDVTFEAPAGESNLAVFVSGAFSGVNAAKVVSFTVGSPSAGQAQKTQQGVQIDSQGERIHTVPADSK